MPRRLVAFLTCAAAVLLGAPETTAAAAPPDLLAPASTCPNQGDTTLPVDTQQTAMLCMVSFARTASGLPALPRDPDLMDAAARKARDIFACQQFSHTACGLSFTQRMTDADYAFRAAGENIAFGTGGAGSVRSVMAGWLNSPGHRANILNPVYRDQGIAVAGGSLGGFPNGRVWVNEFGTPR